MLKPIDGKYGEDSSLYVFSDESWCGKNNGTYP